MKIAIISTPWIAVPPLGYGGTERVVFNIVEDMVEKGHQVTLFATGDSKVSAELRHYYQQAVGNNFFLKLNPYYLLNHVNYAFKIIAGEKFDIIHNNAGRVPLYFKEFVKTPFVTTLHGSYDKSLKDQYKIAELARQTLIQYKNYPFISISKKQREGLPELNYIKTIYNSVILSEFDFNPQGAEEIIWIGRIAHTKGLDYVIKTARELKKQLSIFSFIDEGEKKYFNQEIKPLIDDKYVKFFHEMKDAKKKSEFFGKAKLFLFPIRWDEPFGIVMIEAMACGTPVIAFAKGSVPEVVKDGETGFIINYSDQDKRGDFIIKKTGLEGLKSAVEKIYTLPQEKYRTMRKACRQHVEQNFTVSKMVEEYEEVYKKVIGNS